MHFVLTSNFLYRKKKILTTSGICNKEESSSWSWIEVFGWTRPPWLLIEQ